ncbi:hypothetical protein CRM22_005631 [Opisthorchis felineus]|uniref:Acyl-CoA synthetase short-chain family member 3, mitochondrial n=1 Tax=Opisthorchis felineus TaxID=147828 RepID=A0A4S2LX35_OPIFE|nr:hypothetical protein CRM22_005631 [Opisthorchis felineus]
MQANWQRSGPLFRKLTQFQSAYRLFSAHQQTYKEAFVQSFENPADFWAKEAEKLFWFRKWDKVLTNGDSPFARWFDGGLINTTYNCLDRHIADGYGSQIAVIQESPVTGSRIQYSYDTLLDHVSHLSGYMARQCQVNKGDRVLIYMPMIGECLISMLAAARIGAVHTVVFGGFSPEQLAVRIRNSKPKIIITASYGIEPKGAVGYKAAVDEAIRLSECAGIVEKCIFFHRPNLPRVKMGDPDFFIDWGEALAAAQKHDAVPVESNHPLYLIYTSGTTGNPKGVVRDSAGYSVALKYSGDKIYDIRPGDVWWAASEFGWVVGHSYCCYAPLIQRATTIIYEGKPVGTPDASQFFRVAAENKVSGWFMTPSAARAIRNEDPELRQSKRYRTKDVNLNNLRNVFVAGEHCDVSTAKWLVGVLPSHVKITDTWWQTETGWPITSSCLNYPDGFLNNTGLAAPEGSAGLPVPGYNVQLVDQEEDNTSSQSVGDDTTNEGIENIAQLKRVLVKLPMPPGTAVSLWKDDQLFKELYFEKYHGYYDTMDLGYRDEKGFVYILSRTDDVINVSGHRLSTSALEEACLAVPDIVDCAVIAISHEVKGHVPFGLLVMSSSSKRSKDDVVSAAVASVRKLVGPVAAFRQACVVPKLPKTRSGKISRGSIADMAAGKPVRVPITIEDISVYGPIHDAMKECGLQPTEAPKLE